MEASLYDQMGGHDGISRLVYEFYAIMDTLTEVRTIREMHPTDLKESAEKLVDFLSGWSGGPPLFHTKRGNPMLRYRHLPFAIGDSERDQWMLCMEKAIAKMGWPDALNQQLLESFRRVADHMRNRDTSTPSV